METVNRYFTIKDEVFYMYSRIEGDYGYQMLCTYGDFEHSISQSATQGSAPLDFNFRLGEMQYFLQIFQMFNPKFKTDYGISEESPQTRPEEL